MTILSIFFGVAVLVAWFAHERWAAAARQRIDADRCTRCGRGKPEATAEMEQSAARMCAACRQRTQRTYRVAAWFFYLLALLFIIIAPREVATDYRTFGAKAAQVDVLLFALVITVTLAAGFAIQHFGRKVG